MADLERVALALLADHALAGWIQQRLDARVRHLLIDEFQDTSPLQWHALHAWLSSYAGAGSGAMPSLFIVGDPKQSIYRFRRAEPRVFEAAQRFVVDGLGGTVAACDHTRRNAPAVLAAINRCLRSLERRGRARRLARAQHRAGHRRRAGGLRAAERRAGGWPIGQGHGRRTRLARHLAHATPRARGRAARRRGDDGRAGRARTGAHARVCTRRNLRAGAQACILAPCRRRAACVASGLRGARGSRAGRIAGGAGPAGGARRAGLARAGAVAGAGVEEPVVRRRRR